MARFIKCDLCGKLMPEVFGYLRGATDYHRIELDGGRNAIYSMSISHTESLEGNEQNFVPEDYGISIDACDKCFKKIKSSIDILKKGGN